ncbi:MAG: hypothetical protein Q4G24_06975 [Paracoccus sp. (in: a-proteobacteria)]|uniref:hypothetical protein n=1 Tax=Paracoccus sp. TaxID=267 RepID=UPI0026E0015A|nr:hypothetical protein [Paracoccus sp. (in: a-proteobacteria)]MDO5621196.1 hypothetical protein [Paracoccus sp. (in: a-proteobacteria)]
MGLYIRMILYFVFGNLSGLGFGLAFDADTGIVSIHVDQIVSVATGAAGFVATFIAGRWAKARGGAT